jgi:hypothetical protein
MTPRVFGFVSGGAQKSASRKGLTALVRALAGVLLAAGVRTALQADLLAVAGRDGVAFWGNWLGRADVGFDSDFFGHGKTPVRKKWLNCGF